MNNYVLEYLADTARTSMLLIERLYQEDMENPLFASKAATTALTQARLVLNNIGTSVSIDGRGVMAKLISDERDKLIDLTQELEESGDGGAGLEDEVILEIKQSFEKITKMFEESMR